MTIRPCSIALTALAVLASTLLGGGARADGLPPNWPMAPSELERRFAEGRFRILEVKSAGAGVTGAARLKLEYEDGRTLKVKWKVAPGHTFDGWNNSPRRELAAYAIQRWITDENDYLVPTVAPVCIPMEDYKAIDPKARPSRPGTSCVLGVFAVWIDEVTVPEKFYFPERFRTDPAYARSMADFNLLAYLIEHRDGRDGNLLISTVPGDPRVFAIDNGIAFDAFPWNFLVRNWHKIRVPWLNKDSVDRLRSIGKAEIEALGVVVELQAGEDGIFRQVPPGPNIDDDEGARIQGNRVQFGLNDDDLEDLEERVEDLLEDVDEGKIAVR